MGKKYIVELKNDEQEMLTGLIASGTQCVRKINHAHILVKADDGWTDQIISEAMKVSVPTIERVRERFVEQGLEQALRPRRTPAELSASTGWNSGGPPRGSGMQSTSERASILESALVGKRDDSP